MMRNTDTKLSSERSGFTVGTNIQSVVQLNPGELILQQQREGASKEKRKGVSEEVKERRQK